MPLDKLPVPTIAELQLQTTDVGSVFQTKMNAAVIALRNALIAYNNQIDAALTASQQVEPAPFDVAVAGENNSYKMTPLRVRQAMERFGVGLSPSPDMRVTPIMDNSGGVDFNALVKPGWYKVLVNYSQSSNFPPLPPGANGYWWVHVKEMAGGDQIQQIAYAYLTAAAGGYQSPSYAFERCRYDGYFSPKWNKLYGPDVGTVQWHSLHGSVGSDFEFGANPNGMYVKFADGTMLAWGTPLVIANQLSNNNVGTFGWSYYYENNSVPFPAVFAAPPAVQVTPQGAFLSALVLSSSASAFVVAPITTISITAGAPIMYIAIGRWR